MKLIESTIDCTCDFKPVIDLFLLDSTIVWLVVMLLMRATDSTNVQSGVGVARGMTV
jgi:hypothetical protein